MTGGVGPSYSYLWDNGENTATASNLSAGTRSVTIVDGGTGLSYATTVVITEAVEILASVVEDSPVSCFGLNDGSAIVTIDSGGIPPFSYAWDKSTSTVAVANDLVGGQHTIIITDSNSCETTVYITINQPEELQASAAEISPVVCNGEANGEAQVTVCFGHPLKP